MPYDNTVALYKNKEQIIDRCLVIKKRRYINRDGRRQPPPASGGYGACSSSEAAIQPSAPCHHSWRTLLRPSIVGSFPVSWGPRSVADKAGRSGRNRKKTVEPRSHRVVAVSQEHLETQVPRLPSG